MFVCTRARLCVRVCVHTPFTPNQYDNVETGLRNHSVFKSVFVCKPCFFVCLGVLCVFSECVF